MSSETEILHVSDTALMVAACRALETARPDGLVCDPFAEHLAGERGIAIARAIPRAEMMCFGVGLRSKFLDELVMDAVTVRKVETVVSLGAGLDTRPWRLDLPADLRWIEVDFPAMLEYKSAMMAGHPPKCRLEQMAADVNESSGRGAVFAAVGGAPALMITEGLLMYLPAETIEALAVEPARMSGIQYWLMDLNSREFSRRVRIDACQSIERLRAENHLDGVQMLEVFTRTGWTAVRSRSYVTDAWAAASGRIMAMVARQSASDPISPPPPGDPSGVHLFGRAALI